MSIRMAALPTGAQPMVMSHVPTPITTVQAPAVNGMPPAFAPAPVRLNAKDLPDPASVEKQRDQYQKSLQQQLEAGVQAIVAENGVRKKALQDSAQHQKQVFFLNMDKEVKMAEMRADQECNERILALTKEAHAQRHNLETQAATLTQEYGAQRSAEQHAVTQAAIHKAFSENHGRLAVEAQKLQQHAQHAGVVMAQPTMSPMRVAAPGMMPQPVAVQSFGPRPVTMQAPGTTFARAPTAMAMAPSHMAVPQTLPMAQSMIAIAR